MDHLSLVGKMAGNDIVVSNIKKQLALNSGQLNIVSQNGSYTFVNSSGNQLPVSANASDYVLSNIPAVYQTGIQAQAYNYAKGVFGGQNVPDELVESLASLATYYASTTGTSVQDLFKDGTLQGDFMESINTFLNQSLQFGYQTLNVNQPWVNNPTLQGNMSAALTSPNLPKE